MDKDILIYIRASQTDSEDNKDTMEFYSEGKLRQKESNIYISYSESEITGMEGTKSTLRIADDSITLIRFGSINSKMIFQKEKRTRNKYETPYGIFDISVFTKKMEVDLLQGEKSTIQLDYVVYFDDENYYRNELFLSFKN